MWDVTEVLQTSAGRAIFLLTHPVWDVTLLQHPGAPKHTISTHTSRVGCDGANIMADIDVVFLLTHPVWDVTAKSLKAAKTFRISTHTSRVGCDYLSPFSAIFSQVISTHTSRVGCDRYI